MKTGLPATTAKQIGTTLMMIEMDEIGKCLLLLSWQFFIFSHVNVAKQSTIIMCETVILPVSFIWV
jgi:hypothetical protein